MFLLPAQVLGQYFITKFWIQLQVFSFVKQPQPNLTVGNDMEDYFAALDAEKARFENHRCTLTPCMCVCVCLQVSYVVMHANQRDAKLKSENQRLKAAHEDKRITQLEVISPHTPNPCNLVVSWWWGGLITRVSSQTELDRLDKELEEAEEAGKAPLEGGRHKQQREKAARKRKIDGIKGESFPNPLDNPELTLVCGLTYSPTDEVDQMEKNVDAAEKRKANFQAAEAKWEEIATISYKICKVGDGFEALTGYSREEVMDQVGLKDSTMSIHGNNH